MSINRSPRYGTSNQRGFTIVELLVTTVLSLLVILGVTNVFISGLNSRTALERTTGVLESGRYAMERFVADLQMAGYYGPLNFRELGKPSPVELADFCDVSIANLYALFDFPVIGHDSGRGNSPDCVPDRREGTDVLVVHRVSTCEAGAANCASIAGAPYFQSSRCNSGDELQSDEWADKLTFGLNDDDLDRTDRDCVTQAPIRRFRQEVYFVANNDLEGDGVPTLKLMTLGGGGREIQAIATGVEQLQIEYGLDDWGNTPPAAPETFTTWPSDYDNDLCDDTPAICEAESWSDVVSVRIHLLVRSQSEFKALREPESYNLGLNADGSPLVVGPYSDDYDRQVFTSTVALRNRIGLGRQTN